FVVCRGERPAGETGALVEELRAWVAEQLGAIAKPDDIRFADNLPKTRSGKIMRRLLRAIARGEAITQDISTLENPAIVEQLRGMDSYTAAPEEATLRLTRPLLKPARKKTRRKVKRASTSRVAERKAARRKAVKRKIT